MAAGVPLPTATDIAWATLGDDYANAINDGFVKDETINTATGVMTCDATFASASTITFVGDVTATYVPGRRLRLVHGGGTTYCSVLQSVFSAGNTTVTIVGVTSGPNSLTTPITSCSFSASFPGSAGNDYGVAEMLTYRVWGL